MNLVVGNKIPPGLRLINLRSEIFAQQFLILVLTNHGNIAIVVICVSIDQTYTRCYVNTAKYPISTNICTNGLLILY